MDYGVAAALKNYLLQVNMAFFCQSFHQMPQTGKNIAGVCNQITSGCKRLYFCLDTENQIRDAVLSRCTSVDVRRKLLEEAKLILACAPGITVQTGKDSDGSDEGVHRESESTPCSQEGGRRSFVSN